MNKFYAAVTVNAVAGMYLMRIAPDAIPPVLYWIFIICLPLLAVLSIISFGTMALGWALLMSDDELTVKEYAPGTERAKILYDTTVNSLAPYNTLRFYMSFAASMLLIVGIARQEWTFILVLEVLGSALGYGFIHWVMNNLPKMYERSHGADG